MLVDCLERPYSVVGDLPHVTARDVDDGLGMFAGRLLGRLPCGGLDQVRDDTIEISETDAGGFQSSPNSRPGGRGLGPNESDRRKRVGLEGRPRILFRQLRQPADKIEGGVEGTIGRRRRLLS